MPVAAARVLLLCLGYLAGSIPYAVLVSRARGVDIRAIGSRNPGAHNVMVYVGRWWGRLVAILDLLKGVLPALLARRAGLSDWDVVWVGVAAMLGHITSPFLGFRGGKGVSTAFGLMLVLAPLEMVIGSVTGLTVLRLIGFVPLAAAVAAMLTFALMIARGAAPPVLAAPWITMGIALIVTLVELISERRRTNDE
ncbi:MAG TPA: glycerol-3-phosphate acyltransferase [Anaerolineae bacterium]|nr:glycerol-3-phosphate acyltransferase [Anaerolineae bacterium]